MDLRATNPAPSPAGLDLAAIDCIAFLLGDAFVALAAVDVVRADARPMRNRPRSGHDATAPSTAPANGRPEQHDGEFHPQARTPARLRSPWGRLARAASRRPATGPQTLVNGPPASGPEAN